MGLFVSSKSSALGPGVYAIAVKPPNTIRAKGTGTSCIVEQFPWGPSQTVYQPSDSGDRLLTYAPPGMSRLGSGYLAISGKAWPDLRLVRVLGATAAKAQIIISSVAPVALLTVVLKFGGTAGNSVVGTVSAASDGDANHFNLTVTVTGASGTTTDTISNINISGVGADALPSASDLAKLRLVGSLTKTASGLPVVTSTTFSGGTDGTITSADYVGTAGTGDKGLALIEAQDDINVTFYGDPGNSIRAACNAGMKAHVDLTQNRVGFINGNSGQTAAAAQSDVANYRSLNLGYVDPWYYKYADQDGSKNLVPGAALAASVACQLPPSTKISWRDPEVLAMIGDVVDVEAARGSSALTNSNQGIVTITKVRGGAFAFYTDNNTSAPLDPTTVSLSRTRMGAFVLTSIVDSIQSNVNGPNTPATQQPLINAIVQFMETLKANANSDPAHNAYVLNYWIGDPIAANPQSERDAGNYSIPLDFKTDAGMQRIFIPTSFGETVNG